ncbi:MAG: DegT/DnrJ/EryC1/StrS family aminotransferase [Spirochaetaceae bacterium]|jgi:dTDP-4-amino-4,6-dideoxygalactose transaminase|nr:DegT/DnrJ/EryC1/StrS family aminotransferase [Spirochaetaceae bacterium]
MVIEVHSPTIRRKEMDAVLTVLVEEKIGPGKQAERLIEAARERLRFEYCLALRSPAAALFHALKLLGLPPRSGVVISALSPAYYLRVIDDLGFAAIFCDTAPDRACPGAAEIETAYTAAAGTETPARAVVLHHSLGFMPDMEEAAALGFPLIEDCSAACMSSLGEKKAGSYGIFTILGLEERDMLTSGGGALLYAAEKRNAQALRNAGPLPPEYGLPDMNAAMAIVQFRETEKNLEKRAKIAGLYTQAALRQGRHKMFASPDNFEYNNYAFPLLLETGMKEVSTYAKRKEIIVESAFAKSPAALGLVSHDKCPNACSQSLRTALLPVYPRLGAADVQRVAKLIQTLP